MKVEEDGRDAERHEPERCRVGDCVFDGDLGATVHAHRSGTPWSFEHHALFICHESLALPVCRDGRVGRRADACASFAGENTSSTLIPHFTRHFQTGGGAGSGQHRKGERTFVIRSCTRMPPEACVRAHKSPRRSSAVVPPRAASRTHVRRHLLVRPPPRIVAPPDDSPVYAQASRRYNGATGHRLRPRSTRSFQATPLQPRSQSPRPACSATRERSAAPFSSSWLWCCWSPPGCASGTSANPRLHLRRDLLRQGRPHHLCPASSGRRPARLRGSPARRSPGLIPSGASSPSPAVSTSSATTPSAGASSPRSPASRCWRSSTRWRAARPLAALGAGRAHPGRRRPTRPRAVTHRHARRLRRLVDRAVHLPRAALRAGRPPRPLALGRRPGRRPGLWAPSGRARRSPASPPCGLDRRGFRRRERARRAPAARPAARRSAGAAPGARPAAAGGLRRRLPACCRSTWQLLPLLRRRAHVDAVVGAAAPDVDLQLRSQGQAHLRLVGADTWIVDEPAGLVLLQGTQVDNFYGIVSIGNPLLWWASIAALPASAGVRAAAPPVAPGGPRPAGRRALLAVVRRLAHLVPLLHDAGGAVPGAGAWPSALAAADRRVRRRRRDARPVGCVARSRFDRAMLTAAAPGLCALAAVLTVVYWRAARRARRQSLLALAGACRPRPRRGFTSPAGIGAAAGAGTRRRRCRHIAAPSGAGWRGSTSGWWSASG